MAQGALTEPAPGSTPQADAKSASRLRAILAGLFIAGSFLFFTWRGLLVYYTGDDLMNLDGYLGSSFSNVIKANFFFWTPFYRPFGGLVYRIVYGIFGFNPYPLYVVFFAALLANLLLAYLVLRGLSGSREIGAIGALLWSFHGKLDYLYYNAGSLYDAFCFLFYFCAVLIYLRARRQNRLLGAGETAGFLACFICALNSKEMAASLPVMLLIWELLFHPPDFRRFSALVRWCLREGRMALIGGLCVLAYIPAKLGADGLTSAPAYVPHYNLHQYLTDTGYHLANLLYRTNRSVDLGVTPLTQLEVGLFYAALILIGLWLRSRIAWFGLLFFVIGLLPVSFVAPRLGFVLYLPLAGMALFAAVALVRIKDTLRAMVPSLGAISAQSASLGLFIVTAVIISVINYQHWTKAPSPSSSPYKQAAAELSKMYPTLPHGSKVLFVHTPLDYDWSIVFLMRIYYRDHNMFITLLNGPPEQRIPVARLGHYDHIFTFEHGHYVELDNTDAYRTVTQDIKKDENPSLALGEAFTIGHPGALQYLVKGVQVGAPDQTGYWTLDQPEFRFHLSTTEHHLFMERFFLPRETLRKTGPLHVDLYVNGHLLDQATFAKDGISMYQHDVPENWLSTNGITTVRMFVHNPYISPPYNDRLGVMLMSASFNPPPEPQH